MIRYILITIPLYCCYGFYNSFLMLLYIILTSSPSIVTPLTNGMVNCIPSKTFAGPYMFSSIYDYFVVGPTKITQESKTDRTCDEKSIEFLKNYAIKHLPSYPI